MHSGRSQYPRPLYLSEENSRRGTRARISPPSFGHRPSAISHQPSGSSTHPLTSNFCLRMAPGTRVGADADRDAECQAIRRKEFGGEKTPQSGSKAPSVDIQYAVKVVGAKRLLSNQTAPADPSSTVSTKREKRVLATRLRSPNSTDLATRIRGFILLDLPRMVAD